MQVNIQNIQRPSLFQDFFSKLITYSNEVIEYINTSTINNVTSTYSKTATALKNVIKKTLKNDNYHRLSENKYAYFMCPAVPAYDEITFYYFDDKSFPFSFTMDVEIEIAQFKEYEDFRITATT